MFFTTPFRNWPTSISSRMFSLLLRRSSSISLRLDITILRFSTSILRILLSISFPINLLISPGRLISTCEAGRKTGTPISTSKPPLIRLMTLPLTISPSFLVSIIVSQPLMRSALRLLNGMSSPAESISSSRTSTSLPGSISSELSNSLASTTPSLFRPISIMTSLPIWDTIVPLRIVPGSRESTFVFSTSSRYSLSSSPNISLTRSSSSSCDRPSLLIIFLSTINQNSFACGVCYFQPVVAPHLRRHAPVQHRTIQC